LFIRSFTVLLVSTLTLGGVMLGNITVASYHFCCVRCAISAVTLLYKLCFLVHHYHHYHFIIFITRWTV